MARAESTMAVGVWLLTGVPAKAVQTVVETVDGIQSLRPSLLLTRMVLLPNILASGATNWISLVTKLQLGHALVLEALLPRVAI